jgi:hypothetical protein
MPTKASRLVPVILGLAAIGSAANAAHVDVVTIDDNGVFPESVTSTRAGDLIIGSFAKGAIYRSKAGAARATLWLDPVKTGLRSVLGVLADEHSNTLYVCSIVPPGTQKQPEILNPELAALRTFDLKTGAPKANYPMPDPDMALCNDIGVDKDGSAYITDTTGARILRLKKGGTALEVWSKDDRLAGADGVALGNNVLYVNTVTTSRLFRIAIGRDGAAGPVVELQPSLPLDKPDGMRALGGNRFLLAESAPVVGRISEVTVKGDTALLKVLKVDPGVTAMTRVANRVWVNNAKFSYRSDAALKDKSPEPFTEYAIPLH